MSVSGPAARMTDDKIDLFSKLVIKAARQISSILGYGEGAEASLVSGPMQQGAKAN